MAINLLPDRGLIWASALLCDPVVGAKFGPQVYTVCSILGLS